MLNRFTELCLALMQDKITEQEFLDEMMLTLMRASLARRRELT